MRKVILILNILLTACIATSGYSQTVIYSEEQKFNLNNDYFNVLGKVGNRYYTFRATNEGNFLDAYNAQMEMTAIINLDFLPNKYFGIDFIIGSDFINVLYQYAQNGQTYQMVAPLDAAGKMIAQPMVIDSVASKTIIGNKNESKYSIVYADNKEVIASYILLKKERKFFLRMTTFSPDINILSQAEVLMQSDDEIFLQDYLLSREGVLIFSSYEFSNNRNQFNNKVDLYFIDPVQGSMSRTPVPLNGKNINGIRFKIDNKTNNVRMGAFYSDKKSGNTEGFAYGTFPQKSDAKEDVQFIPVPETLRGKADVKKRKSALNDFYVKDIIVRNDGGLIFVTENYFETIRSGAPTVGYGGFYNMSSYGRSIREYTYGDMLIVSFDNQGGIQWGEFLRKNQFSQNDQGFYSSYNLMNTGANLVFIYNENLSVKNQTISINAINAQGDNMVQRLPSNTDKSFTWVPRLGKQTGALEVIIPCFKSKGLSFAKITF